MNPDSETITFQPQKGMWVLFLLVPLFAITFSLVMMQYEIKLVWWVPPSVLILFAALAVPFFKPYKIVLDPINRTMEVQYWLTGKNTCYAFDELEAINTHDVFGGEGDTYIQLELLLTNGHRIVLITTPPVWGTFLSGYKESEEISGLRRKIAAMTGIKDLGFKPNTNL